MLSKFKKYFIRVSFYVNNYVYSRGVYASNRNANFSKNVGQSYNSYYHIHHFTVNLIK